MQRSLHVHDHGEVVFVWCVQERLAVTERAVQKMCWTRTEAKTRVVMGKAHCLVACVWARAHLQLRCCRTVQQGRRQRMWKKGHHLHTNIYSRCYTHI